MYSYGAQSLFICSTWLAGFVLMATLTPMLWPMWLCMAILACILFGCSIADFVYERTHPNE